VCVCVCGVCVCVCVVCVCVWCVCVWCVCVCGVCGCVCVCVCGCVCVCVCVCVRQLKWIYRVVLMCFFLGNGFWNCGTLLNNSMPYAVNCYATLITNLKYHHHHHHISVMELGHLLTRFGLTCPEASSNVCNDSFCQLGNCISLPWVICYEIFYLHVASSYSCIPVIFIKLVLF